MKHMFPLQWLPRKHKNDTFSYHRDGCYKKKRKNEMIYNSIKKWVDWISTRREKIVQPQKCTF